MMKPAFERFRFCPVCGADSGAPPAIPLFSCSACEFHLHFNPAVSAGAFLFDDHGRILLVRRAHAPARGLWGLPGGFIDYGERAETALRREILEETGLTAIDLRFLCSQVNDYDYRGVRYPVVDLFFRCRQSGDSIPRALDGVTEWRWALPASVELNELAFPSLRAALRHLLEGRAESAEETGPGGE